MLALKSLVRWVLPLAVVVALAGTWLTGRPQGFPAANDPHLHPSGLVDPLLDDSGEFAVAWHTWGVAHPPGYPLLGTVANVIVRLAERLSQVRRAPADAASDPLSGSSGSGPSASNASSALSTTLSTQPVDPLSPPPTPTPAAAVQLAPPANPDPVGAVARRAGIVSWLFGLLTLFLVMLLVLGVRAEGQEDWGLGASSALLILGFGGLLWLYSVVAEVYTFGLFLAIVALVLADGMAKKPGPGQLVALALVVGLAVGHHRVLLLLVPALVVAAGLGPYRQDVEAWGQAFFAAILGFLVPYIYLPLVAKLGSVWVYGRSPATWDGFSDALFAREYGGQLIGSLAPEALVHSAAVRLGFLAAEMSPLALTFGLVGLLGALAWSPSRRLAIALALIVLGYLFAPVSDKLMIGTHLGIMLAALAVAIGWGLAVTAMGALGRGIGWLGLGLSLLAAGLAFVQHRQIAVLDYTTDRLGDRLVDSAAELVQLSGPDQVTIAEVWGPRYFALAAGKWVTGALVDTKLLDVRADLSQLPPASEISGTLVTSQDLLHLIPTYDWSAKLGAPVHPDSAGDGLVALRYSPRLADIPTGGVPASAISATVPISGVASNPDFFAASRDGTDETGILIVGALARQTAAGDVLVRVEWQAERRPPEDFHVYVYASDRAAVSAAADILAQADRAAPVYGFSPTSSWVPGQRVRDDYRLERPAKGWPKGRAPRYAIVGLYRDGGSGQTEKLSRASIEVMAAQP